MSPRHQYSLKLLATWFGCGLSPKVPGTVGTLGAIPVVYLFSRMGDMSYMVATFTFIVLSIFVAQLYEDVIAHKHDSCEFVMDEVAGFLVTMTLVPFTLTWVLLGFGMFRFFDMLKPFPISYIDKKMPGGVGAVADDLLAGVFANIVLQAILQRGWLA